MPKTHTSLNELKNELDQIRVLGARQNNLKNLNVSIPHGKLIVVTGPSGCGKSSLAIHTIFAEGQRQYVETLSTYARQFVGELPRPDFDSISGLQPTLCIDQHPSTNSPRSTVGTVTEIHDFLRVLMARAADIHCHQCGSPIQQLPSDRIVQMVTELPDGTKAMILSPLVRGRKGKHDEVFEQIRKAGLLRVRVDGQMLEVDSPIKLNARQNHSIEAVTDRIVVREGNESRITESIELALTLSGGTCIVRFQNTDLDSENRWTENVYSTKFACMNCDVAYVELEPKNFSFNSPYGACPKCEGLGWLDQFDPDMILDASKAINQSAVVPWQMLASTTRRKRNDQLSSFFDVEKVDKSTLLDHYTTRQLNRLVYGDGKKWQGLITLLEKELATATSEDRIDELESFRALVACPDCDGSRLGPQARSASVDSKTIIDINRAPLDDALDFFENVPLPEDRLDISQPLVNEVTSRLRFLCRVGLGYLTLDRPVDSLSGGEYQRVRLASSIGNGLANVCYVLDEPTIGLHPADNHKLIESILDLKRSGNTVIVVEHDGEMMKQADWILDIGPKSGRAGGQLVYAGEFDGLLNCEESSTAQFLSEERRVEAPPNRDRTAFDRKHVIRVKGASGNNLKNINVDIPLGLFVCVTGVSGSGKSTLIQDTVAPAVRRHLGLTAHRPEAHDSIEVLGQLDHMVQVDQKPIGRSSRSNPATYSGVMDSIRKLFASTKDAKARGFTASRFSFNSKAGWCPECQGYGDRKIEMNFLPNMRTRCDECRGRRFNFQTLEIRYRDHSIADVLDLPINEACEFFENIEKIHLPLRAMKEVGLGYLSLGQPSPTLSGGEAQRVKLATEMSRTSIGHSLYLLDEPTTGLHFEDVSRLLRAIHRLVDQDNSVIVIEHHMDLVRAADWVIDLGPEGGEKGGQLVSSGLPEEVAACKASKTGKFL